MADVIVTSSSLGDVLAYSVPVAVGLGSKPHFFTLSEHVSRLLEGMPHFAGEARLLEPFDRILFTGAPGMATRSPVCPRCPPAGATCSWCGKSPDHHRMVVEVLHRFGERCYGEWYGFERPLNAHFTATESYRPRRIVTRWGLPWSEHSDRLDLDWYADFARDWACSSRTVLVNLVSASAQRTYPWSNELLAGLGDYDVRLLDPVQDIRTNLFLVAQAGAVLSVDTSTAWLARFLRRPLYLIAPGGLQRHCELGCEAFLLDESTTYRELQPTTILEAALRCGLIG